jgi:hypothetical protein
VKTTHFAIVLLQVSERFEGLKSFKDQVNVDWPQILVVLVLVPAVAAFVLYLIRKHQETTTEKASYKEVVEDLGLDPVESRLLQRVARGLEFPTQARVVQNQEVFDDSVRKYVRRSLDRGQDPRMEVKLLQAIRHKLDFLRSPLDQHPASTRDLDLPLLVTATSESVDGSASVEAVLLEESDRLALFPLQPGLEVEEEEIREDERITLQLTRGAHDYTFSAPVLVRAIEGTRIHILLRHSSDMSYARRKGGSVSLLLSLDGPDSLDWEPVTVEKLDPRTVELIAGSSAAEGLEVTLKTPSGSAAATGRVVDATRNPGQTFRILVNIEQRDDGFPRNLDGLAGTGSPDVPAPA